MSIDLSVRQLLACLNVSVFDPVTELVLKKIAAERKKRNVFFDGTFSCIGMLTASLLCFWGIRGYFPVIGGFLFCICGLFLKKTQAPAARFVLKTYFLSGSFLLGERLFLYSPCGALAVVFLLFLWSLFVEEEGRLRTFLSVLLFAGVYFAFPDDRLIYAGIFSVIGTAMFLFPLKRTCFSEAGCTFVLLPLFLLLGKDLISLTGTVRSPYETLPFSAAFSADFALLVFCLRRDLDLSELFRFAAGFIAALSVGVFLSAGLQGAAILFVISFFTDFRGIGKTAAFLFCAFFIVLLLSMQVSLSAAGVISLCFSALFGYACFRMRRK